MQKTVFITGATGGIGSALVKKFVENDWFIIGQYHNNEQKAKEFSSGVFAGKTAFFKSDFSSVENATALGKTIAEKYEKIDCIIHCAGRSHVSVLQEETDERLREIMNVDLLSPMALTRELIPGMVSLKAGVILAISSIWGRYGGSCEVAYSAAKGGLDAFIKALSKELGASGIRANVVSCGFIDTEMNAAFSAEDKKNFADELSLGRLGTPEEVAEAAYFLCSEKAAYVTGQILGVDGGF